MNLKPYAIAAGLVPMLAGATNGTDANLFNLAQKGIPQDIERAFHVFDKDGDGYIDRHEADSERRLSARLDNHDGDGDGRLNKAEFTALVAERGNNLANEVLRSMSSTTRYNRPAAGCLPRIPEGNRAAY